MLFFNKRQGSALPLFLFLATALGAQQDALALKSRQAKELMAAGRFAEAIPIYEELVRAIPGNPGLILGIFFRECLAVLFFLCPAK